MPLTKRDQRLVARTERGYAAFEDFKRSLEPHWDTDKGVFAAKALIECKSEAGEIMFERGPKLVRMIRKLEAENAKLRAKA